MFCPYIRKTYTKVVAISYAENEAENGSIIHEIYKNEECKKEQCGAWSEGRCRFNG